MTSILTIIFIVLLVDSLAANALAWFGNRWYAEHFRTLSRFFPMAKGWTVLYLVLVIFIGFLIL